MTGSDRASESPADADPARRKTTTLKKLHEYPAVNRLMTLLPLSLSSMLECCSGIEAKELREEERNSEPR
jgi:hypothetical protein